MRTWHHRRKGEADHPEAREGHLGTPEGHRLALDVQARLPVRGGDGLLYRVLAGPADDPPRLGRGDPLRRGGGTGRDRRADRVAGGSAGRRGRSGSRGKVEHRAVGHPPHGPWGPGAHLRGDHGVCPDPGRPQQPLGRQVAAFQERNPELRPHPASVAEPDPRHRLPPPRLLRPVDRHQHRGGLRRRLDARAQPGGPRRGPGAHTGGGHPSLRHGLQGPPRRAPRVAGHVEGSLRGGRSLLGGAVRDLVLPDQDRTRLRLRSGRIPRRRADVGLLLLPHPPLRRRLHAHLGAGAGRRDPAPEHRRARAHRGHRGRSAGGDGSDVTRRGGSHRTRATPG